MPTTTHRGPEGSSTECERASGSPPEGEKEGEKDHSGTPLPKKLGIREGSRVLLIGPPAGFDLGPLASGAVLRSRGPGPYDVVLLFVTRLRELDRRFVKLARQIEPDGRLWVAWPKKASGLVTDLTFDQVQRTGLESGLVDNKSASFTEDFRGLQFVVRVRDREGR